MADPLVNDFLSLKSPDAKAAEPVKIIATAPAPDPVTPPANHPSIPENTPPASDNKPAEQGDDHTSSDSPNPEGKTGEQPPAAGSSAAGTAPAAGIVDPAGQETPEQQAARQQSEIVTRAAAEATQSMLREFGVESLEELRSRLAPAKTETPEEKKRREDLFRASMQKFAVEELNMTPDDFVSIESTRQMSDTDLVFAHFKTKWLTLNKDNPEFKGKDLDQEARYEFDGLFHVNSENERIRTLGEQSLKETADGLRAQQQSRYEVAENEYRNNIHLKEQALRFKHTVQSSIKQLLPKQLTWDIEGGEKVTFSLDKVDQKGLEKYLVSQSNFDVFLKQGSQEAATKMEQQIKDYIAMHHFNDAVAAAISTAHSAGLKKGAVGAKAPFNMPPLNKPEASATAVSKDDDAKVGSLLSPGRV